MSEQLDVLVITQFFPPESMGGSHRWEKLAANLDEEIKPHILCTQPTFPFGEFKRRWRPLEQETVNGMPVTRLFTYQPESDSTLGRILNYGVFSLLSTLYVLFTFWRYDCVVTMSAPHTTFLPGLMAKLLGRTWIIDIFDLWIDNAADLGYVNADSVAFKLISNLERIAFASASAIFVITETMSDYYKNKYFDFDFDVHIVPFGIDTSLFSFDVESTPSADIIYTGNLGNGQAFVPFLKGFSQLDGKPELIIVGDGERREEPEILVKELHIEDRVTFKGYVPREEIPKLLTEAKVSLVPLKTEYQLDYARPTKLLETMAVGTPYVASSVREIDKLSQQHEPGVAAKNDARVIKDALEFLLSSPHQRKEMGANGVKVIASNHNWEEIGKIISKVMVKSKDSGDTT